MRPETTDRPFFIAGFGLALLTVLIIVVVRAPGATEDLTTLAASFELSAGALGIVAATSLVGRWRLSGNAQALWLGTAVGVYSTLSIALAQLLPVAIGGPVPWVRPAGLLVSLALFVQALVSPEVNSELRPRRTFGVALTGYAVISLLVIAIDAATGGLTYTMPASLSTPGLSSAALSLAWAGFGAVYVLRGMRERRLLLAWYGLTLFGLALAELVWMLAPVDPLSLGSAMLRCIAMLYAAIGVLREFQRMFASQSRRLLQSTVDTLSTTASLRAAQERQQELAHEARNALTAIEGATQTLERFREKLDDDTRRSLAVAVSSEIGRLQQLVGPSSAASHPVSFRLADIIGPQVDLLRAQNVHVAARVASALVAYGVPGDFAEALQNVLVNARVHGRGPVTVDAVDDGQRILVRVEDHGPGVPKRLREAIFERGRRASEAEGTGLGLFLSRDLMRRQEGDLWVGDAAGGGAAFVLAIPAGQVAMVASFTDSGRLRRVERGDQGGKPPDVDRAITGDGAEHTHVRARTRRRERQDPVD